MKVTISYIKEVFDKYNRLIFGGALPDITIKLSNAKSFLGVCSYKKRRDLFGRTTNYDFVLRINSRVDMTEELAEDTIVHEMIHYYIAYRQIKDTSAHGQMFHSMMNEINSRYNRHITISHKPTQQQREQTADCRRRWHVVAVVTFIDGRTGIKVLPRIKQRIVSYYRKVLAGGKVTSVDLFITEEPFFNKFPTSSALNVCLCEASEYSPHLSGARRMECDGWNLKY